jgi:diguanylate cyclase (GGDEF)-like protein
MSPAQTKPAESGERVEPEFEQLRIVYASLPLSLLAVVINSIVIAVVLWPVLPLYSLSVWLFLTLSISLLRWFDYKQFDESSDRERHDPRWSRSMFYGVLASAVTWSGASLLLFPADSVPHQMFLAFVIAGMSAGAVTTLSAVLPLATLFLVLNLTPLIGQFLIKSGPIGLSMAFMTVLFLLMLVVSARRLNQTIVESLHTRNERQQIQEKIHHQALHDELTSLPNRRFLLERLRQEIARAKRRGHLGAVLFLDMDNFKTINDSLGHRFGDRLLHAVATRIQRRVRDEDTAARLGGDEFVILMPEAGYTYHETSAGAETMAQQVLDLLRRPFDIDGHELHLSASVGIVVFPTNDDDAETLLQKADVAMYSAKESGKDSTELFMPRMQVTVDRRLQIERGLRRALGNDELALHYQPQVDADGRLIGAEALLRWQHPDTGPVSPSQFVPIAEETGLIYRIGDWVVRQACEDMLALGPDSRLHIAVNITPRQFRESNFAERVLQIIDETGASPEKLVLEITEGAVIEDVDEMISRMQTLKSAGIRFSVDDFGTGHSSLAYLKRLPLDVLKIDQSFVRDIETDPNDAVIVETIIAMARHLGLEVIAEGVETAPALAFLCQRGCRQFQGYLFGKAMPLEQLRDAQHRMRWPPDLKLASRDD